MLYAKPDPLVTKPFEMAIFVELRLHLSGETPADVFSMAFHAMGVAQLIVLSFTTPRLLCDGTRPHRSDS